MGELNDFSHSFFSEISYSFDQVLDECNNLLNDSKHKITDSDSMANSKPSTIPCGLCGRKFLPERINKHVEACRKIHQSKRKPFDSKIQRMLSEDELTNATPSARNTDFSNKSASSNTKTPAVLKTPSISSKSNWREQHEDFIRTVRAARGESVDTSNDVDADGNKKVPAGYIKCPTCERNFNRKAAERHITFCADQKLRLARRSPSSNSEAMNKFKARTTYKASPQPVRKTGASIAVPVSRLPGKIPSKTITTTTLSRKTSPTTQYGNNGTSTTTTVSSMSRRPTEKGPPGTRATNTHKSVSPSSRRINGSSNGPNGTMPVTSSRVKAMMNASSNKSTPKTPIVKFKDKFPNNGTSVTSQYIKETNALKEMFKRPDTNFSNLPRTVPGVRTGGMSPTRAFSGFEAPSTSNYGNSMSMMKRSLEDLYLRENSKTPPSKNGFMTNGISLSELNARRSPTNGHTRGSTSGSSGGGDGDQLMVSSRKSSGEENARSSETTTSTTGSMPRWCHQCGTKYPMTVAKYCYECGARRLGTLASLV